MTDDSAFEQAAGQLRQFPHSGKRGLVAGPRAFLTDPSDCVFHDVGGSEHFRLTIVHTSR